ncbi:MAG: hypothetical protein ACRDRK_10505 [Pseudonocardia sp.]
MANWGSLFRQAVKIGRDLLAQQGKSPPASRVSARTVPAAERARTVAYAPDLDGAADPGEIVWAWVPYEEHDGRGKVARRAMDRSDDHGR